MGAHFDIRMKLERRMTLKRRMILLKRRMLLKIRMKKIKEDGNGMTETGSPDSSGDHEVTEIGSQGNDDELTSIFKNYDLYLAAKTGNLNDFHKVLDRVSANERISSGDILSRLSPVGNTVLHVATVHRNENMVTHIAAGYPSLLLKQNFNGDTALHLAAKAGDESMVKLLVQIHQDLLGQGQDQGPGQGQGQADSNNLLRAKNERENTAFHEALINGQELVAQYLIEKDPELAYYQNKRKEYGLYLAAKAGFAKCVSSILKVLTDEERIDDQFKENSPIQAAIVNKNRDVLVAILNRNPLFIKLKDGEGRTPLHYAASSGNLKEFRYLLKEDDPKVFERDKRWLLFQRDKKGLLPIHMASAGGHVDIIDLMIQYCPDLTELIDNNGCNILHVAAKNGRFNVVRYILDNPGFSELINMKNKQGNVPLHLATEEWHPRIVSALTWDKRVNVKLVNDQGMTALDAANYYMWDDNPPFRQRLTWTALKAAGTPRSQSGKSASGQEPNGNSKERVNTLLLVSTLIATITFAAGFTLPGGYNSSNTDVGVAALLREKGFHVFVFCDTIAMYSSVVVAIALIWAQLGDLNLILAALNLALPLLGIAIGMMSLAFAAGIFLVVSKLSWLSTAVLVMGFTFLVIQLVLFFPLCMPLTSSNRILRYLCYCPFCFLMYATGSYST